MSHNSTVIVDYGLGNLFSIRNALEHLGGVAEFSSDPDVVRNAERIVLPGVGAFGEGMRELKKRDLVPAISDFVATGRPLIGICLGMQLLMSESEELGLHQGLGLVGGRVVQFESPQDHDDRYKIPHIGWNRMERVADHEYGDVLQNLPNDFFMYFVHSYYVTLDQTSDCLTETDYGRNRFCSSLQHDNVIGFQGHPERSGEAGLAVLTSFLSL